MALSCPVTLAGHELNQVAVDGLDWSVSEIPGWWDGVETDVARRRRYSSHGEFGEPGHTEGRLIIINGKVSAPTAAHNPLLDDARELLVSLLADGGSGTFQTVEPAEGLRWADVQRLGRPEMPTWRGTVNDQPMVLPYQFPVYSELPYKFGALSTDSTGFGTPVSGAGLRYPLYSGSSPGNLDYGVVAFTPASATVSNPGRADASVVIRVAGPTPEEGFRITDNLGRRITYTGECPPGSELVFNGFDSSIQLDGQDRSGQTDVDDWPEVPAGESLVLSVAPLVSFSAANFTFEAHATYW